MTHRRPHLFRPRHTAVAIGMMVGFGQAQAAGTIVLDPCTTYADNFSGDTRVSTASKYFSSCPIILTGTNTYTGGTWVTGGHILQIGDGGTKGSITGNVDVDFGSRLAFNRSDDVSFGGVIKGSGVMRKLGAGALTFTEIHNYGYTEVDSGNLVIKGVVENVDGFVGKASVRSPANALATVTVTGMGSKWINRDGVYVGASADYGAGSGGTGLLTIQNGGAVASRSGFVGGGLSGNGRVTVTGAGSQWNTDALNVGDAGQGALNILDGGAVSAGYTAISNEWGSKGTATVNGAGSQLMGSYLVIGRRGQGTLNVQNGGVVKSGGEITIGLGTLGGGSATGTVTVSGAGSQLITPDRMLVGVYGQGTLNIQGGGTVKAANLVIYSNQGTVNLDGGTLQVGDGYVGNGPSSGAFNWVSGTLIHTGNAQLGAALLLGKTLLNPGQTLQIGDGGSAGTLTGNNGRVLNNGTLAFNRADHVSFADVISGSGQLTKLGAGTLTLTGANSYSGDTTIARGALDLGGGGTTGAISSKVVTLGSGAGLVFNRANDLSFAAAILDGGNGAVVQKLGAGTLTLTGDSSYQGQLYVSAGTLNIQSGGKVGTTQGLVAWDGGNTDTVTVTVSGAGSEWNFSDYLSVGRFGTAVLNIQDGGRVRANNLGIGANSEAHLDGGILQVRSASIGSGGAFNWATGTLIHTGNAQLGAGLLIGKSALNVGQTLQIGDGGTAGELAGNVLNHGTLAFNRSDATSFAGDITGSGALTKSGAGTLTLAGIHSYTGATAINGGMLAFTNAGNQTLSGAVTGSGALTKAGSGTLTLAGINSYTGATAINGGTLAFTNAGNQTLSGHIAGSGVLAKSGAGTLTLSGDNSHTGATRIQSGTLLLSGQSRSGSFDMASGAVLELNVASGTREGAVNTQFIGNGSLRKTGAGESVWTGSAAVFAMGAGSLIDIQGGRFNGGSFGNEDWRQNKSQLRVAAGATFAGTEANVRVDGIDGAGRITSGFGGAGYTSFTMGVANGSGDFSGVLADTNAANGHIGSYAKAGTGTQILSGQNTYTGGTTILGGVLQIGHGGTSGAIVGSVLNNGTLTFSRSDATSFAGIISGSGSLQKLGAGTLALNGDNLYTGGTQISAGTLVLSGQSRSGSFNMAGGAVLELNVANDSRDGAVNTQFTGQGTLLKTGTGNAYWSASQAKFAMAAGSLIDVQAGSFYGGFGNEDWQLNQSALNVAAGASFVGIEANVRVDALSGGGRISSGFNGLGYTAFTIGVANGSGDFAGVLADNSAGKAGRFVKVGSGTQVLSGTNTYTGGTTITGGTLQIGHGGTTGSIVGNVLNNGALAFNRFDSIVFAGDISGSGSLQKHGAGTLVLVGNNSYSGGTALIEGVLSVANEANLGSGKLSFRGGTLSNTGDLVMARQVTLEDAGGVFNTAGGYLTIKGTVGGAGGLVKTGGNILTLSGAQTYTGATTVSGGLLKFAANGAQPSSVSSAGFAVAAGATLLFADTQTVAAPITGGGALVHEFGGRTTLTGAATHTGGTSVIGGTLLVGQGGNTGTLAGDVALSGGGTLAFNRSDASSFSGHTSGDGNLQQLGSGTLTLTGATDHTGLTRVAAGRLVLGDGSKPVSLAGAVQVDSGASLRTTSDASVAEAVNNQGLIESQGGTLSFLNTVSGAGGFAGKLEFLAAFNPGNSPAAITFNGGDVHFGKGAVLTLDINGTQVGSQYDQMLNIGHLQFDGTLNLVFGEGFTPDTGSMALLGFKSFGGNLGADHITVSGFDRQRLDLSQVASNGSLSVTAVPEPASWVLMLGGVAAIAARVVRWRRVLPLAA